MSKRSSMFRNFNGEKFHYFANEESKKYAKERAVGLRHEGYKVRIIKISSDWFDIWTRKKE